MNIRKHLYKSKNQRRLDLEAQLNQLRSKRSKGYNTQSAITTVIKEICDLGEILNTKDHEVTGEYMAQVKGKCLLYLCCVLGVIGLIVVW